MAADQGEEGREERAARRTCPARDQANELLDFEPDERRSEDEGRSHGAVEPRPAMRVGADACEAAGEAREEQAPRLDPGIAQVEQLPPARPARGLPDQHRVGREKGREHDDVAEQENPKAVTDNDPLRYHLAGRVLGRVLASRTTKRHGNAATRTRAAARRQPAKTQYRGLRR